MYIINIEIDGYTERAFADTIRDAFQHVSDLSFSGCNVTIIGLDRFWFFSL